MSAREKTWDERRRDVEARLDDIAEGIAGDLSTNETALTIADDLIDYVAAYARCPEPAHKTRGGMAWRETSGTFRGVKVRFATAVRRYMEAA